MQRSGKTRSAGFTLLEMLISLFLGIIVLGSAVQLFSHAVNGTFLVTQRAEMQQSGRAAVGLLIKDISLAGAGLPTGGIQLPTATGTNPKYGCDGTKCYVSGVSPAGIAYPNNHLYGVVPGYRLGLPMSAGGTATDVITIAYSDNTFALNQYTVTGFGANGTSIVMGATPTGVPPLSDSAVGIKVGDLLMIQNDKGAAIGEVTGLAGNTINFADLDPLRINQSTAASGNIASVSRNSTLPGPAITPLTAAQLAATTVTRIWAITYYLDIPVGPDGIRYTADDLAPRLMRQVNGQAAAPVADNIADLQFTFDIHDDTGGSSTANLVDAGLSSGKSPNQIRKVNIASMAARSQMKGAKGYQGLDLATSVSVRSMSFRDRYN